MELSCVTGFPTYPFNVNGLRDNRKRELVFNWLVSKKYDCICLQETHCTGVNINRWESEWKTQGGGASAWLCGSSESKGVTILLSKHFAFDINFNFSDKTGRLLICEINTENAVFHIFNIYAPNLCSDRKQFFDSFQNISYNHEDGKEYRFLFGLSFLHASYKSYLVIIFCSSILPMSSVRLLGYLSIYFMFKWFM
jgi:exonuclease III